ncbi:hypothetical protein F9Z36_1987 [Neisseria gonorrhoeae]|nr:hypothetical protein F9Z36_1987 [Neisseria gonorrhoeae]
MWCSDGLQIPWNVDAATGKTARVRLAAAAGAIGINNTVRHDFLFDGRGQRFRLGIVRGNGIGPPVAFRNAEDNRFSCRAATASAFTPSAETACARPGGALENLIGSQGQTMVGNRADFTVKQCRRIGMDTQISAAERAVTSGTKERSGSFCTSFFNLQCVIFIFRG